MPRALEKLMLEAHTERDGNITLEVLHSFPREHLTVRESQGIDMSLSTARLMLLKTLDNYDFPVQQSLDRQHVEALASLEFMNHKEALTLARPFPRGTGKSHLASR